MKIFRRMRGGEYAEDELEEQLNKRGFMNRFYGRASSSITKSWQMYPLGMLFGLGFDTATEIALLATAGTAAAGGLPWYAILCLPILFAAGMSLLDTIDGAFMNFAYGWAFSRPVRKIFYNITITALSVVVALVIGTIELVAVFSDKLSLTGFPWDEHRRPRPQLRRLRDRRPLRRDLGDRALGLALRQHRGALEPRPQNGPDARHDASPPSRLRWPSTNIDDASPCCGIPAARVSAARRVLLRPCSRPRDPFRSSSWPPGSAARPRPT